MSERPENENGSAAGRGTVPGRLEINKARAEAKSALAQLKAEKKARQETEAALTRTQAELEATLAELERERQGRLNGEPASALLVGKEQRLSFVIRVALDDRGEPRRTEIEHAQSGRKETFAALDYARLATFIDSYLTSKVALEEAPPPAAQLASPESPAEPAIPPNQGLVITAVQALSASDGKSSLLHMPGEAIHVHVHFWLSEAQNLSRQDQGDGFWINVYAREVATGISKLLATRREEIVDGTWQYTTQVTLDPLPPGIYSLFSVVALRSAQLGGYYEGPVIQVMAVPQPGLVQPGEIWQT